jgi:hypothetical protein
MFIIMRQVYNGLSIACIVFVGFSIFAVAYSYKYCLAHPPGLNGWNVYRTSEFGFRIGPFLLILFGLLITRLRSCPKWLFFTAVTLLVFSSALVVLVLSNVGIAMHATAGLFAVVVFVLLLAAHLRFIGYSGQS